MRVLPVVARVSFVCLAAAPACADDGVALKIRGSGALLVPVEVDGRGSFTFLLDTGSSHTAVSIELAERLALPVVAKARVLTPSGAETALVVKLRRTSVGTASVEGLTPSVVSFARLRDREPGVDGVLGQDFLSGFDFTVDYRKKRLLWRADATGEPLPLVRAGERALVALAAPRGAEPVLWVPDSGAEGFVVFERGGRTAVEVDEPAGSSLVTGFASRSTARAATLRELRLGDVTLRNQHAVVLARDGSREVEGDGLLPLHQFSRVSFSNSGGYLTVQR